MLKRRRRRREERERMQMGDVFCFICQINLKIRSCFFIFVVSCDDKLINGREKKKRENEKERERRTDRRLCELIEIKSFVSRERIETGMLLVICVLLLLETGAVQGKSGVGHYSSQRSLANGGSAVHWSNSWLPSDINSWYDYGTSVGRADLSHQREINIGSFSLSFLRSLSLSRSHHLSEKEVTRDSLFSCFSHC